MLRALCCVVALSACGSRGATPVEPHPVELPPPDAGTDPAVNSSPADAAPATAVTPAVDPSPATPPPAFPPEGTAAYCLYVGSERLVVRCYWNKGACAEQAAFNTESGGSAKAQECRGVAQVFCYTSDKSERCYPTSDDCDHNVASMRQRNRSASDCV